MHQIAEQELIDHTRDWIEKIVLGLNLCPFAHSPFQKDIIRYQVVSWKHDIIQQVVEELNFLNAHPDDQVETTVLIISEDITFLKYLDLIDSLNDQLYDLELDGIIQIASFHPDYQFEGTDRDDITNCTNRSPYPLIHLLRESSVSRAVAQHSDVHSIPSHNQKKLQELGWDAYQKLIG